MRDREGIGCTAWVDPRTNVPQQARCRCIGTCIFSIPTATPQPSVGGRWSRSPPIIRLLSAEHSDLGAAVYGLGILQRPAGEHDAESGPRAIPTNAGVVSPRQVSRSDCAERVADERANTVGSQAGRFSSSLRSGVQRDASAFTKLIRRCVEVGHGASLSRMVANHVLPRSMSMRH